MNSQINEEKKEPSRTPKAEYRPEDIQLLTDLEHVRERPSMYIGDTTPRGLHHLVYEVVDNSIDEAMAGFAKHIHVTVNTDGSVTVEDDGRGIPVERHEQLSGELERDVSTLEGVMTVLKFGGKFQKGAYQTSGGLHGVGVTVVNFLSEWCEVEVCRDGHVYQQEYERGMPTGDVRARWRQRPNGAPKRLSSPIRRSSPIPSSTTDTLYKRLQELAFLNRGVRIVFQGRTQRRRRYSSSTSAASSSSSSTSTAPATRCIPTSSTSDGEAEGVGFEIAMQYTGEYTENVHSYVNNIHTHRRRHARLRLPHAP